MRCLAIAQEAITRNIKVTFAGTQCPQHLQTKLAQEHCDYIALPENWTAQHLAHLNPTAVFADDYHLQQAQWQQLASINAILVNLDDNTRQQALYGNIIVNPAANASAMNYDTRAPKAELLLGPRYSYLRREFSQQSFVDIEQRQQILVTLGGADTKNMGLAICVALLHKLPNTPICILVGSLNTSLLSALQVLASVNPSLQIIEQSNQVASIMMQSGLAISAAGGTLGELASMGTPTIALVSADNQMPALDSPLLNTWYTALDVRHYQSPEFQVISTNNQSPQLQEITKHALANPLIEQICAQAAELWLDLCKRQDMSNHARQIIDCLGCQRIVDATINASK